MVFSMDSVVALPLGTVLCSQTLSPTHHVSCNRILLSAYCTYKTPMPEPTTVPQYPVQFRQSLEKAYKLNRETLKTTAYHI